MSTSDVPLAAASYAPLPSGNPNSQVGTNFGGRSGTTSRFIGPGGNHIFCCCDTRRATLILNGISIVLNLLFMILLFFGITFIEKNASNIEADMDDDEDKQQFDSMVNNGTFELLEGFMDFILFCSILMHACGVYGALKFKPWAIIVAAVSYGIGLFIATISFSIIQIIIFGVFLYPHIILLKEIQNGMMSEMNYEHVVHCCGVSCTGGGGGGYV